MKRLVILGLVLLVSTISLCQIPNMTRQKTVDSLFAILPYATGSNKVDVMNHLALHLAPRTFDSSFRYASEALRLSEKLNYPYGKGIATFNIGNSYYFKADIKNALTNYLTALRILEPYEPSREIANLLTQLAAVNQYVRNTKKMAAYYKRSAYNFSAIGDTLSEMLTYFSLGGSYFYELQALERIDSIPQEIINHNVDSAIKYIDIFFDYVTTRHPLPDLMPDIYNFYGLCILSKDNTKRENYYIKALEATRSMKDTIGRIVMEGLMYSNLGYHVYFHKAEHDLGYLYALKGDAILKKTDRYDIYTGTLITLGEMELDRGLYNRAEFFLKKGLKYSDTFLLKIGKIVHNDPTFRIWGVTQALSFRVDFFRLFVRLYESTGDYKQALVYQKKLQDAKSNLIKDELKREIIGLEANFEDELKRKEIAGLIRDSELSHLKFDRTRILFAGIGGLMIISLLIIVLWIQRRRFRSEQKAIILEQQLLRAQMNPHFIFNALYSIQNFIVTEKPDKASIYLSKFARLVRNILDNSMEEFVALEKEISTIENYIELQLVRYAGKFDYSISIDDKIDVEVVMIPPMLAQPFIENAIEHGIKHRETPGHIDVRFSLKDHTLIFEVEDDGVGRQKALELDIVQEPGHRSMATSLTRERIVNLNRKLNKKIFLDIQDLKNDLGDPVGTRVTFGIPI